MRTLLATLTFVLLSALALAAPQGVQTTIAAPPTNSSSLAIATAPVTAAASSKVICTGPCNVYGASATNTSGAGLYFLLIDATTVPADGALTGVLRCYFIPNNTSGAASWQPGPPLSTTTGLVIVSSSTGCFSKTASSIQFMTADAQQ